MAIAIVALAAWIGSPNITAGWIQGDESKFVAANPDVTGMGRPESTLARYARIFTHTHGDLYQPLPVLTYAIEATLFGERRVLSMRVVDVAIHALNGILLWACITSLLQISGVAASRSLNLWLGWAAALLWLAHPAGMGAVAAGMGRTHLLSAALFLGSLLVYLAAIRAEQAGTAGRTWRLFALSCLLIVMGMLSKVVVGWFLVVAAIELVRPGGWRGLSLPRIGIVFAICAAFAALAFVTTVDAGLTDENEMPLFGDPLARAMLAFFRYELTSIWPFGLAPTNPPDINTGWGYYQTWAGLLLLLASAAATLFFFRERERVVAIGGVWELAVLFPLLGLVGARAVASQDHYLYVPLMGAALAIAGILQILTRPADARDQSALPRAAAVACGCLAALAATLGFVSRDLTDDYRDTLRRAERVAVAYPGDPRARELLAMAHYDVWISRPRADKAPADGRTPAQAFRDSLLETIRLADASPRYYRHDGDRAAFHRRMSFQFWGIGDGELSLASARRAAEYEPDSPTTRTRLAHAFRSLGRFAESAEQYALIEQHPPADLRQRALRLTEFGDLLAGPLERPAQALPRYAAALATGAAPIRAKVGLARCEVLAGQGARGYQLAREVLAADPGNGDAFLVVALYHARSEQWPEAYDAYLQVLRNDPTQYEGLRGFHEVCAQVGKLNDAALAWQDALRQAPESPVFAGFLAWSLACAEDERSIARAEALLTADPGNRFAHLAVALADLRAGRVESAIDRVRAAAAGPSLPQARELERAEATIRRLEAADRVPPESKLVRAALARAVGRDDLARSLASEYVAANPAGPWASKIDAMIFADPATAPVSQPR